MSVPLSDTRLTEIREWLAELGESRDVSLIGPYAALRDTVAEVDRLRARLAEIAELHAPMGGDCGYCADETGGAHRWPCPTARLATAPTSALGAGQ